MTPETTVKIFQVAEQNYRQTFSPKEAEATQALWFKNFSHVRDDKMETAMMMIIQNELFFPNVAAIKKALDELDADQRYVQNKPRQLEQAESREDAKTRLDRMQKYIAAFKDKNKDRIGWNDYITPFARSLFPEISDKLIDQNSSTFAMAMRIAQYCESCIWLPKDCAQGGNVVSLRIEPDGNVEIISRPCHKCAPVKQKVS